MARPLDDWRKATRAWGCWKVFFGQLSNCRERSIYKRPMVPIALSVKAV